MIATWCFVFVGTIRELSAAIMLFTSETKVISVLIFDLNESGDLGGHLGARPHHAGRHLGIVALANRLRLGGGSVRLRDN